MTVAAFFKLVEIQTKAASMVPFLLGTLYAMYEFHVFRPLQFVLMLLSLLCIDMATTAINNYQDFKKAALKSGYGYETHNAIVGHNLSEISVRIVIAGLLCLAVGFGLLLFLYTDMVVLIAGILSFAIGILYSVGPVPISRTPFGEICSGGCMGFIIPFLAAYIHIADHNLIVSAWNDGWLSLNVSVATFLPIVLLSVPSAASIANIMLANNICDIEEDVKNRRYTLPVYIGRACSLQWFKGVYYCIYAVLAAIIIVGIIPGIAVIVFATWPKVSRNIRAFSHQPTKRDTFRLAVQNFILINGALVVSLLVAIGIE